MLLLVPGLAPRAAAATAGQVTRSGDVTRTGWYDDQPGLSPAVVGSDAFGQLFSTTLDGQIYGQPLVANGVLVVATENNVVYGLDPETGAIKWQQRFGTPFNPQEVSCGDLIPSVGITSTPVVDTATNTVYVVSNQYVSGSSGTDAYYLHALDLTTGAERAHFPTQIQGTADNNPAMTFNAFYQTQRPGLLLLGGRVYAAFSAHCQYGVWAGWVFGVDAASGQITSSWVDHTTTEYAQSGGGIWMSGGGLASDGPNQILLVTGNAVTPNPGAHPGDEPPADQSDSVVRLTVQPDGTLKNTDFFVPADEDYLDSNDLDMGSSGIALLPDQYFGTASIPHLAVVSGKNGDVYLLNRDQLGGEQQGPGGTDDVVAKYGPNGGVWSQPTVWPGDGGYVYIPTASQGGLGYGTTGQLTAYKYGLDGSGRPALSLVATSSLPWGFGSSAVQVTSDGTKPGSALLWAVRTPTPGSGWGEPDAELDAFSAVPNAAGDFTKVFSAPVGNGTKFTPPGFGPNGRVYVGTHEGRIIGFGAPLTSGLTASSADFPATAVGGTSSQQVTFTAQQQVTVTDLKTAAPFGAGTPTVDGSPVSLPVTLDAGQDLDVPVTFQPTAQGATTGTLTATTAAGSAVAGLTGAGVAAGPVLTASTDSLAFGTVAQSAGSISNAITLTNTGSQPLTFDDATPPGAPFTVTGAPAAGQELAAGASVIVTISMSTADLGTFRGTLSIGSSADEVSVAVSGTVASPALLSISPLSLAFGSVPVGQSASRSFTITNTGGSPATISVSKPPSAQDFHADTSLPEGSTIAAGASVTETVSFTPTSTGDQSDYWQITGTDGQGPRNITFTGTGTDQSDTTTLPAVGTTGWTLNGDATTTTNGVILTPVQTNPWADGSTFYDTPIPTADLTATFDATLNQGTGADGLTITLADPTQGATPTALGTDGGGLGYSGIPGIAIALDTYQNGADPSANFIGISTGPSSQPDNLTWLATNTDIPDLRAGTNHITVTTHNGILTVTLNGTQVLSQTITLPTNALIGFTAASGGLTDQHTITNTNITYG